MASSSKKDAAPKHPAAAKEKDQEEPSSVVRVDLGESLPTPKIPTATDNE